MAKVITISEQYPKNIERGTIVRLINTNTIGIVYNKCSILAGGKEYYYYVLWFDAKASYSVYEKHQLEIVNGYITIKN